MTTQPKQTTRSEEVIRKAQRISLACVTQFLSAAAGSRPWLDAIRLGRRGAQVPRFFRRHPDDFRGASQIPRSRAPQGAGRPAATPVYALPNEAIVAALRKRSRRSLPALCNPAFSPVPAPRPTRLPSCSRGWPPVCYDIVALRHAYSGGSSLAKSVTAQSPWRKSGVNQRRRRACHQSVLLPAARSLEVSRLSEVACAKDVENLIQTGTSGPDRRVHRRTDPGSGRLHHNRRLNTSR